MSNRKEPYASEAESAAVIAPYTLSAAEKKLHDMMDERGAWKQGAETYPVLYQIAIELLEREAQVVQSTTENSSAVEQLAPQGSLRCNTPKKCALYVCSPLAWPSEQPAQQQAYEQANPLGGPAKVFDAMADAIRAGDSYHAVLRQYGYAEAAQSQQEPVATYHGSNDFGHEVVELEKAIPIGAKLYTSPPAQRKPLTDEQVAVFRRDIVSQSGVFGSVEWCNLFARAIEAAHGIKGDA